MDNQLKVISECRKCALNPERNFECSRVIPGQGNLDAKVLIVGRCPDKVDDRNGTLDEGGLRPILATLKQEFNFNYETDAFVTNVLMCHAPSDYNVKATELNHCKKNLEKIFDLMPNLKLIMTLGPLALKQIEGSQSILSTRVGNPGEVPYKDRYFYTLPLKHPSSLTFIENSLAIDNEKRNFIAQLSLFHRMYENIDNIHEFDFDNLYDYKVIYDPEEAMEIASQINQLTENDVLCLDYETHSIKKGWAVPVGCAFSWEDLKAVYIPFNRLVDLPEEEWYYVKAKKSKSRFLMKWKLEPWFDDGFEQKFMKEIEYTLGDPNKTGNKSKPMITGWNTSQFESKVTRMNYEYELLPSLRQITEANSPEVIAYDGLLLARLVVNEIHSLKFEVISHWLLPLEASTKSTVQKSLTESELNELGFALFSRKIPEEYEDYLPVWAEQFNNGEKLSQKTLDILHKYWDIEDNRSRIESLGLRACYDCDGERRVAFILRNTLHQKRANFFSNWTSNKDILNLFE